jgi:hypothetical protein
MGRKRFTEERKSEYPGLFLRDAGCLLARRLGGGGRAAGAGSHTPELRSACGGEGGARAEGGNQPAKFENYTGSRNIIFQTFW